MEKEKVRPIIIIKKKGAHGGHHGGAWKVARQMVAVASALEETSHP